MKIALVSPYDVGVFGGVQNQVLGLARAFSETDEVVVFSPGQDVRRDGVEVLGMGRTIRVRANGSLAPIALVPSAWTKTERSLHEFRPDVIHVHEPFVPLVGLAAARTRIAPVVATFHRGGAGHIYPHLRAVLGSTNQALAVRIAVSEEAVATLESVFGTQQQPPTILPNAIDIARFAYATHLAHSGHLVVFVGRHEHRKGLRVLLEAFGEGIADARLVVIGDGPDSARLRAHYEHRGRVDFVGALDDKSMASYVASADLVVAPSISGESFGVVLLEAMAANTAVIASDIPGYRISAGAAARFFPPGDAVTLREAIVDLLDSPEQRNALVAAGAVRAAEHSFSSLASAYREVYQSIGGN
jgi:phosphatidylinositol alpha-mannosyltransferase